MNPISFRLQNCQIFQFINSMPRVNDMSILGRIAEKKSFEAGSTDLICSSEEMTSFATPAGDCFHLWKILFVPKWTTSCFISLVTASSFTACTTFSARAPGRHTSLLFSPGKSWGFKCLTTESPATTVSNECSFGCFFGDAGDGHDVDEPFKILIAMKCP